MLHQAGREKMKTVIAALAKSFLYDLGHYSRRLSRCKFRGVAVLCYHGVVSPGAADLRIPFRGLHVTDVELESHCRFLEKRM